MSALGEVTSTTGIVTYVTVTVVDVPVPTVLEAETSIVFEPRINVIAALNVPVVAEIV